MNDYDPFALMVWGGILLAGLAFWTAVVWLIF